MRRPEAAARRPGELRRFSRNSHSRARGARPFTRAPTRPVPVPLTPEMSTSQPERLEFVRTDPLALRHVTARFLWETMRSDRLLERQEPLGLPMLLM